MKSNRLTIHLDHYIVDTVDDFIEKYSPQPSGRVINIILSIFLSQDKKTQQKYIKLAKQFVNESTDVTPGVEYGDIRKGKKRITLFVSDHLKSLLNKENKKVLIIASLLYVGLIKK